MTQPQSGWLLTSVPASSCDASKNTCLTGRPCRQNILPSIFLLAQEKDNVTFMHEMARRSGSRVFHLLPADLGRCLLMDFLKKKKKRIR
jgi:hypothetical protein